MAQDEPVALAAISGAHGVTGEVRLKLFGEGVKELSAFTSFNGGSLTLVKIREGGKGGAVARFAEVTDRDAAERLRGTVLAVPRNALAPPADDEFYFSDLVGLPVISDAGEPVGIVRAIENFGASDIVEIEKPDGRKFMVPLVEQAVPEWNSERLVVNGDFIEA